MHIYHTSEFEINISFIKNKTQININNIHKMTSFVGISIHTLLMSRFIIHTVQTYLKNKIDKQSSNNLILSSV
jgi:hypothetical protein